LVVGYYVFVSLAAVVFGVDVVVMLLEKGVFVVHSGFFFFYGRRIVGVGGAVHFLGSAGSRKRLVVLGFFAPTVSGDLSFSSPIYGYELPGHVALHDGRSFPGRGVASSWLPSGLSGA